MAGLFTLVAVRLRAAPRKPPVSRARAWTEAASLTGLLLLVVLGAAAALRLPLDEGLPECTESLACGGPWLARRTGISFGQQVALQLFVAPLCLELVGRRGPAAALAAGLFGLAHLPSPLLMVASAATAALWVVLYWRLGRLVPLIASHLVLSVSLELALPERLHYGMNVGSAALAPRERAARLAADSDLYERLASEAFYEAAGGTDDTFLSAAFQETLGRPPTELERSIWGEKLTSSPRTEVVADLLRVRSRKPLRPR